MVEDSEATDEALVLAFQKDPRGPAGRRAATQLLSRWQGRAYSWAYRFAREREQALDLAQDCLLRVYQALPRYQARGKFSAWIFTIVHNASRDFARRRRHIEVDDNVNADALPATEAGPEAWLERMDDQRVVMAALRDALEPDERMAIWLRAYEGMSVEDITRTLGLESASGARGLLQTARRKLRAALGRTEQEDER